MTAVQQMRDLAMGMQAYIADYSRPPIPGGKAPGSNRDKEPGWDTIYGDPPQPKRNYGNFSKRMRNQYLRYCDYRRWSGCN